MAFFDENSKVTVKKLVIIHFFHGHFLTVHFLKTCCYACCSPIDQRIYLKKAHKKTYILTKLRYLLLSQFSTFLNNIYIYVKRQTISLFLFARTKNSYPYIEKLNAQAYETDLIFSKLFTERNILFVDCNKLGLTERDFKRKKSELF